MSMPSKPARTPKVVLSLAWSAISAACSSALVGMQPRCRQVPPTLPFSMSATRLPSSAARSAQAYPPLPATVNSPSLSAICLQCLPRGDDPPRPPRKAPVSDIQRDLDEAAHGRARSALRRVPVRIALVERGPRDVEVRPPRPVGDELPQEQTADQHPAIPFRRHVRDVGHG